MQEQREIKFELVYNKGQMQYDRITCALSESAKGANCNSHLESNGRRETRIDDP